MVDISQRRLTFASCNTNNNKDRIHNNKDKRGGGIQDKFLTQTWKISNRFNEQNCPRQTLKKNSNLEETRWN